MNNPVATNGLTFLRPYLFKSIPLKPDRVYLRFFNSTCAHAHKIKFGKNVKPKAPPTGLKVVHEATVVEERVNALIKAKALSWPRIQNTLQDMTVAEFLSKYKDLKKNEVFGEDTITLRGRMTSCRVAGKSLAFLDLVQDYVQMQVVCNWAKVNFAGVSQADFKNFLKLLQRGDIICKYLLVKIFLAMPYSIFSCNGESISYNDR